MASAARLYTPAMLGLATTLAAWPWAEELPLQARVRAPTCGSVLTLGLAIDAEGRVARLGLSLSACAVGQAAAALFAASAEGAALADITIAQAEIERWLTADGELPRWPGFDVIAAARDVPGRHGAILLAWQAAIAALSTSLARG